MTDDRLQPHQTAMTTCSTDGCDAHFRAHKWGHMKAQREGWFFSRESGHAYCPDHVPDWVEAWRARKASA